MPPNNDVRNVVWKPVPGTSQEFALTSPCNITLYTGTRGPGKTDAQLMFFRKHVGVGYGPFWRGVIFSREYKELDDLVSKSRRWFPQFYDGCEFKSSKSDYKWVWPTGEELLFRAAESIIDYWKYHGHEYPFMGWNELTAWQDLELFDMMMSCNRSSYKPSINGYIHPSLPKIFDKQGKVVPNVNPFTGKLPPPIPLQVFATTNPFGVGHGKVKKRFIDCANYGEIVRVTTKVFDPEKKEEVDVERTQVSLFGNWRENPYLDPVYIATLINDKDPNRRKAWAHGNWDIISGGPFDSVWDSRIHIIPRFKVPSNWYVDRSFDWGSSHPGCCQWWAEANGEAVTLDDGTSFCPPPGTLIQVAELYSGEVGSNAGFRWPASVWAQNIKDVEFALRETGYLNEIHAGPADNQIRNVIVKDQDTIEQIFNTYDVYWEVSDKSPGSRKNGLQLAIERLDAFKKREGPGLAFTKNCIASHSLIPTLPIDPKKIDDVLSVNTEDHSWDACRYRILKGNNRYVRSLDDYYGGS